ncbi:Uncharacterised protein [Enterobacter hormaechei]|nr:Uncharacterised protein [Enterobacter hormaechei]
MLYDLHELDVGTFLDSKQDGAATAMTFTDIHLSVDNFDDDRRNIVATLVSIGQHSNTSFDVRALVVVLAESATGVKPFFLQQKLRRDSESIPFFQFFGGGYAFESAE